MSDGPSNFNRPSDSIIAAINAPAWPANDEMVKEAVEANPLEALIEMPLPIGIARVVEEPVPLLIENISDEKLDQRRGEKLLLSKTSWGETVIAFLDSLARLKDDEDVISLKDISKYVDERCDSVGVNRGEGFIELRSLLNGLQESGVIRHYERGQGYGTVIVDGFEGYLIPTDPQHHEIFLVARACNQVEEFAPDAIDPTKLFLDMARRSPWPVPISDFVERISQKGGEECRGSTLENMCYAIWPSADQNTLLRLEALTRCAIAAKVVEIVPSEVEGLKYIALTESGRGLLSEVRH